MTATGKNSCSSIRIHLTDWTVGPSAKYSRSLSSRSVQTRTASISSPWRRKNGAHAREKPFACTGASTTEVRGRQDWSFDDVGYLLASLSAAE
jgi:hypothetical protein